MNKTPKEEFKEKVNVDNRNWKDFRMQRITYPNSRNHRNRNIATLNMYLRIVHGLLYNKSNIHEHMELDECCPEIHNSVRITCQADE